MSKLVLLGLLAAGLLAQRGNVNWTQIRLSDPIPLPGNNPLVIKLSSGHTANGLCVQSYAGSTLFCVDKDGNIQTYGTGGGKVELYGSTSGSVVLDVPAIAGSRIATFPAATGTVMLTDTVLAEAQEPTHDGDVTNSAGDLTLTLAAKHKTLTKSLTLLDPMAGDSGSVQMMFPYPVTITRVACSTKTATSTVTFNFEKRVAATPDTAGTSALSADLVADTNQQTSCASGCDVNTITSAAVAANIPLALTVASVANAPAVLRCFVTVTVD